MAARPLVIKVKALNSIMIHRTLESPQLSHPDCLLLFYCTFGQLITHIFQFHWYIVVFVVLLVRVFRERFIGNLFFQVLQQAKCFFGNNR